MQARLRAQLGDRPEYSGERRRRSVVVASIVLTITDPLRGSYPLLCNLQAALIRSCGASFACMELTIISRFQRLQTSRKYSLHSLFYSFSVLSPKACPYVMIRPPIVAVINHRICEGKRNLGIFLFAFSDNLISEDWFFTEGERFLSFWRCHRTRWGGRCW